MKNILYHREEGLFCDPEKILYLREGLLFYDPEKHLYRGSESIFQWIQESICGSAQVVIVMGVNNPTFVYYFLVKIFVSSFKRVLDPGGVTWIANMGQIVCQKIVKSAVSPCMKRIFWKTAQKEKVKIDQGKKRFYALQ